MNIIIERKFLDPECIQRLVKSKDKNEAYDKTEKYLKEVYFTPLTNYGGNNVKWSIRANETIE